MDTRPDGAQRKLGFSLCEIPEWQCCGAVYPQANDEIATRLSSVRALMAARDAGQPLVSLCSACHHVLKRVNGDMQHNEDIRVKVNNYLKPETPYEGETKVLHYLEVLRDEIGWDAVKAAVVKPLTGRKIGAYYGCMLLRPSREMQFDDPENPKMLEDFIRAIGAEPVILRACATNAAAAIWRSRTGPTPQSRHRRSWTTQRRRARSF
ncbi:MAG: heterodisulfide reductase-related iron-sulfur binding cluster [Oscillospiraceae bacterium]